MRKFWLENSDGKVWDLTPKNPYIEKSSFFADPSGLGIKTKISSFEVENTSFIESIETQSQTISGDLYFANYDHFRKFLIFIGNVNSKKTLKLYYSTEGYSYDYNLKVNGIDKFSLVRYKKPK